MRTDRRHICLRCLYRQPGRRTCALCGHEALADTAATADRAAVLARLEERVNKDRAAGDEPGEADGVMGEWALKGVGVILTGALAFVGWGGVAVLAGIFGVMFMTLVFWRPGGRFAGGGGAREGAGADLAYPEIGCVEANVAPGSFTSVVGRVRCVKAVNGPVSGLPCAAVRVKGSTAGGAVDDALCGEFDLLDGDGEVVARVRKGVASVDIPVEAPKPLTTLTDATPRFLQARMLLRSDGRATLGEARVEDGDEVTCEGPSEAEPAAATYRENRAVPVYRGTSARPVIVRRAEVRS
jgi:hypothetical protein